MKKEYNFELQQLQIDNMIENDIDYWIERKHEIEQEVILIR